jgi:hypothetical protein
MSSLNKGPIVSCSLKGPQNYRDDIDLHLALLQWDLARLYHLAPSISLPSIFIFPK